MIRGIGLDVCQVARFEAAAARPGLLERVFTPAERDASVQRMAGRFAAKEAFAKALGAPAGLAWHDVEVVKDESGAPSFRCVGSVSARLRELGISTVHLTITHDAGIAAAVVICES